MQQLAFQRLGLKAMTCGHEQRAHMKVRGAPRVPFHQHCVLTGSALTNHDCSSSLSCCRASPGGNIPLLRVPGVEKKSCACTGWELSGWGRAHGKGWSSAPFQHDGRPGETKAGGDLAETQATGNPSDPTGQPLEGLALGFRRIMG